MPYSLGINSPRNIFAIFASLARNDNFHKLYTIDRDVFAPLTETTNQSTTLDAQVENLLGHEAEDELMNSEMTEDTIIELRQKVRIEVLNFLFAKIGYNTAWIKANRKQTAMSELFAAIMGLKNPKSIYEHIGRVQYAQKPQDLDVEIAEVNKLLQGINNEWRIAL